MKYKVTFTYACQITKTWVFDDFLKVRDLIQNETLPESDNMEDPLGNALINIDVTKIYA